MFRQEIGSEMIWQNDGRRSGPLVSWRAVGEKTEREKIREECGTWARYFQPFCEPAFLAPCEEDKQLHTQNGRKSSLCGTGKLENNRSLLSPSPSLLLSLTIFRAVPQLTT